MANDHTLEIVARYKDLASKGIKSLGTNAGKMATKAATAMRTVGAAAKKMGRKIKESAATARKAISKILGPLKLLTAAFSIASGAISFKLVGIASDAAETQSKFEVLFGSMADAANVMADGMADSLGRSKTDVREYMATIQALIEPMGIVGEAGLDMSADLATLAVDMASFSNASDADALLALRSALIGESEPLRRFGVMLSEAKVQAEALSLGLGGLNRDLTDQEKVQARYSIIMRESSIQQGDAIRTANEYEGTMKRLKAQIKDMAVVYGERLKVAVLESMETMGGIEGIMVLVETAMGSMVETVGRLIPKMGEIGGALVATIQNIGGAAEVIIKLGEGFDALGDAIDSAKKAVGIYDSDLEALNAKLEEQEGILERLKAANEARGGGPDGGVMLQQSRVDALRAELDLLRDHIALTKSLTEQSLAAGGVMDSGLVLINVDAAEDAGEAIGDIERQMLAINALGAEMTNIHFAAAILGAQAVAASWGVTSGHVASVVEDLGSSPGTSAPSTGGGGGESASVEGATEKVSVFSQAVTNLQKQLGTMDQQMVAMTQRTILDFGNGLAGVWREWSTGAKSAKDAFRDFAAQFLADLSTMIVKALIFKAIMAAIGYGSGGGFPTTSGGAPAYGPAAPAGLGSSFGDAGLPSGALASMAPQSSGGGGGGGAQSVVMNFHYQAVDSGGMRELIGRHAKEVGDAVEMRMMSSPSFRTTMLGGTV